MRISIIDNYDSFVYNIVRYINDETQMKASVFRNDAIDYSVLDQSDAIVLSPGPGIPNEAGDLMKIIERYHQTKPLLGICLGHQALGEFFGAQLIQNTFPLHGKSTVINKNGESLLLTCVPAKFHVGRYHSWSISNSSNDLKTIASTDEGEVMAIQHKSLPITGVQFHPESILTPEGRKMIQNWISYIKKLKIVP